MQPHRQPNLEVVIHSNGTTPGASKRSPRPLSVDEALRFSPMTSAPVFGLDSIMRPDIGRRSLVNWPRPYDSNLAGNLIDGLDNETQAVPVSGESTRLGTAREYLQQLLNQDTLTEFEFRLPATTRSSPSHRKLEPSSDNQLGPFARMILDSADVSYRYPVSVTPPPLEKSGATKAASKSSARSHSHHHSMPSNHHSDKRLKPMVLIPSLPPSADINEFKYISDIKSVKRRKVESRAEEEHDTAQFKAQKQVSDAALVKLQGLLHEIFETEEQLLPDAPLHTQAAGRFFKLPNTIGDLGPVLSSETYGALSKALQKVSDYQRLGDIPTEYIKHLQKLCESLIMSAQSADFKLDISFSEAETARWITQLEDAQNILAAIITLLQTMPGNQQTKEMCPEDLIQAIPAALSQIFDHCIIPAVEIRASGKDSATFNIFSAQKQVISNVIHQAKRVLAKLAIFLSNVDLAEGPITAIEFLAARLIFVENAPNDKESAIGVQKYETPRRAAMDVLAKIFARYPDQRSFILDEILVSLEKLPSNRQSARQFKLADGKSIQLLSALVIQLVQTTALQRNSSRSAAAKAPSRKAKNITNGDETNESEDEEDSDDDEDEPNSSPLKKLSRQVGPPYENAVHSAQYITKFIVQRAMTSTKTGDQPYRNLLDLFTEDLINVLGSTDWPGAELILRVLASQMITIADHDKSTANAKNMSLELLGWMGSAISELASTAQHLNSAMDDGNTELSDQLRHLFDDYAGRALHVQDIVELDGPYRVVLEFLEEKDLGDWQLSSARGYLLTQWAKTVCGAYEDPSQRGPARDSREVHKLAKSLSNIVSDPKLLESNSEFDRISTKQARFAYLILILSSGFCKGFDTIVKVLLNSITSDQAKVRSRSLKSVIQMLERDPSLLDRDGSIMALILRCATDSSPMVRDSALSLIAKCMFLKPALEENCCRAILACASDPTIGVRKRCIGLMKDVYVQTSSQELKLAIIEQLLSRVTDHENSVSGQARQAVEEMWFTPFYSSFTESTQGTPQSRVSLDNLVNLIVGSVRRNDGVISTFGAFIKHQISPDAKSTSLNFTVCKALVAAMFERVVHDSEKTDKRTLQSLLQSITVFARVNAHLFTPDQLETLHPYIGHLSNADDLMLFRSVVIIYRCVLPHLSKSHNTLLKDIQNDLFKSVSKLARTELNEVMACLWTINSVLQNTERLVKLAVSVLKGINQYRNTDLDPSANADALSRVRSYIRIAGCVGKHCDLESFRNFFAQSFPHMKSTSVAGLITDFIIPFTSSKYSPELRVMALESLGAVCETWPAEYGREATRVAFTSVFKEDSADLQNIILKGFLAFFSVHEGKSEKLIQIKDANGDKEGSTRLGGSLKASENDGAAALIAQNFLQQMLHAALSKEESYALTAIELIASINRQGLIHPKECAGVLVALETSRNPAISKVAFETHKMLHQQHESMFDREYMRAVQDAFHYQRDVVGDPTGAQPRPFTAKLAPLFEIIKISNSKYQKKFLTNMCLKIDFEPRKLDVNDNPPEHLLLARFICQNLAYFEYAQIGELLATIVCMERIVGSTGTTVAHAIDTDIFPVKIETANTNADTNVAEQIQDIGKEGQTMDSAPHAVDPNTLKQLATAAATLSLVWETRTYLRRLYGISAHSLPKEGKAGAKEVNKALTKVQGVSGDRLWDAMSKTVARLADTDGMMTICREFATLMSIDDEMKLAVDDDMDGHDSAADLGDMSPLPGAINGSRPGKRRSSFSNGNVAKKPRPRGRPKGSKKKGHTDSDQDDFDV